MQSKTTDSFSEQLGFIREADKLKSVLRQTYLIDGSRRENDAEHSWHLCLMAMVLEGYSNSRIDLLRVIKMLVIHDLVEIYAGDTFCYDNSPPADKLKRESEAADKLFGMLPADQCSEFRGLWDEFENKETQDAKFAAAIDRMQPILHNLATGGAVWRKHHVSSQEVRSRNSHIKDGSGLLWDQVEAMIKKAVQDDMLDE